MNHLKLGLAICITALPAATLPALAASSSASSASDSASTSVGSSSTSFEQSSESSKTDKVADGDYKVIEMAAAGDRPGTMRLKLQALANATPAGEFVLYLPEQTVAQNRIAAGGVVTARQRDYGVEFAQAGTRQAFFLVLKDEWHRELQSNAVVL